MICWRLEITVTFVKVLHDQVLLARRFLSLLGRHGHMWWLRLVVISTTAVSHGWWAGPEGPPEVEPLEEQAGWRQHLREWLPGAERRLNATEEWLAGLASWGRELEGASTWGSWDVALWMVVDTLFGMIGWALFGSAWTKVRTGCRRLLQVLVVLGLCLVAHYVWAVCYPIVSLLIGACMAMAWLLRKVLRGVGAFAFWFQRVTGGSPEASEAEFLGPATGRTPETSQLRAFKRSSEQPKYIVVKRGEDAAVFAIGMDSQSIKTHGLYVPVECNTIRGSPALVRRLRDVEKVHLCRNEVTHDFWAWLKGSPLTDGTSQLMHRLRELGSESEQEEEHLICCGSLVTWRGPDGTMQSRTRAVEDIDEGENDDEENGVDNEEAHGDEDRHGRARKLLGRARECEEPEIKERTPRSEGAGSLLEEFFEIFAAGKADGLREDQARKKLGADRLLLPGDLLRQLVGEAENEQAQGQRGLSRFLTTWRKELAKVEEKRGDGLRVAPPGIYRPDIRAGARTDSGTTAEPVVQIAKAIQHQTAELASLVRQQTEGAGGQVPGTIRGLNKQSEELVFLLRACGQYQVRVGAEEHGQALANSLLSAQIGASTKLRAAGFRQRMSTRLAVGIAGPYWGIQEKYGLSAADFLSYTDAELDQFASEAKVMKNTDQRPPPPSRFDEWTARVRRQTDVWCLVYGEEWRAVRNNALNLLSEWHLSHPHRWPLAIVIDIWEEIHWRFLEELKDVLRSLKKEIGRETISLTELKFHALLPGPDGQAWLVMPTTFDIEKPDSWFQTEVLPRIERKQDRLLLWNLTWQGGARKDRNPAAPAGGAGESAGSLSSQSKPTLKSLWGPKLTPEEVGMAKDRAPLDRHGKLLCWGNLCHIGCQTTGCQRSHEGLRGSFENLDPCVQMQLLKRGGLKRMKLERRKEASESWEHPGREQEVTEDGRAGGEGPKVRFWDVPEEFEVDYTKGEDLKDVIQGPDYAWRRDVHRDLPPHRGRDGTSAPQEAKHLVQKAQELGKSPALQALEGATDDLYAWAAARVAREPGVELSSLLQEMATYGMGELAREAAELLEQREGTKAGSARLVVRDTLWAEGQPGQGSVELDGTTWRLWDYQEDVMMTEDLAALLHLLEVSIERRQCVTITIAAMVEWKEKSRRPSVEQVQTRAQSLRLEQTRLAVDAANTIGEAEEMVAAVEHEVRTYIHDLTTAHHEKDFRSLEALADCRLVVFRADYRGGLVVECIIGSNWIDGGWTTFALIWKGHMVLLEPPDGYDLERFLAREDPQTTPAMGFTFFWHARHDQPPTAPGKIFCRLCKAGRKAGESLNAPRHSCLSYTAATAGGSMDIHHDHNVIRAVRSAGQPHEPGQLVLREFFAGKGGISAEWSKTSPIMEPVEVYEHPHDKQGYRAHFDLSRKDVHDKFLAEVRTGPSNVHWIAAPCASYCDWQQKNGGTRTFECPEGTGQGPLAATEAMGNILSAHAAELFEASLDSGAFPLVESSGVSGRYPKQWDLPCWKRILNRPDVEYVDLPMCAFGLGPPDEPDHFYVHKTRVVFPLHPPLRRALRRVCPGLSTSHRHIGLKGCRDGQTVTRCTEAGVYAQNFVSVVVAVLQASLGGGLALTPQDVFGIEAETMEKMEVPYYLVTVKRLAEMVRMIYRETYPETMTKDMTEMVEASNETINPMEMAKGMACWNRWASGTTRRAATETGPGDPYAVETNEKLIRSSWSPRKIPAREFQTRAERYRLACEKGKGKGTSSRGAEPALGDPDQGEGETLQGVVITDDWRAAGGADPGYGKWTGVTIFTIQEMPVVDDEAIPCEDDWEWGADEDEGPDPGEDDGPEPEASVQVESGPTAYAGSEARDGPGSAYQAPTTAARQAAEEYVKAIEQDFDNTPMGWAAVLRAGNKLVEVAGGVRQAAESLWEVREKAGMMNLAQVDDPGLDRVLHPHLLEYLRDVRRYGMAARFQGLRTRAFAKLHPNARRHVDKVFAQVAKDVGKQRVLVVSAMMPQLSGTMASPFEAVQKLKPDRSVSEEVRVVHDQRTINHGTNKFLHPPALQPTHSQIAKRILWAKGRCPGLPVLLSKKDISGAFRLLWVAPEDVELFAGELPWNPRKAFPNATDEDIHLEGIPGGDITVVYLVSSFGFSGSPGEWTVWGRSTEEFHRAHRPSVPRRDMGHGFDCKVLVDDGVLVEPWVGLRPWVSAEVFEHGIRTLLGNKAVNEEKDKVEGAFKTAQTVWGVIMCTEGETATLPERRIQKGAVLLADSCFDYGSKEVTLKQLQQFRGILTGWAAIVKGLVNELKVCRWLSARTDRWESFATGLRSMLPTMERLSLPGEWEKVIWVSSDATPTMVGAIDWTNRQVTRLPTGTLKAWAARALSDHEIGDQETDLVIHLGEMLSFVAFACAAGDQWKGGVVAYGGDNTIVKNWLQSRKSNTRGGRILIRALNLAEMKYNFTVVSGWWRTYHNVHADFITRCTQEEFEGFVKEKGLQVLDISAAIHGALEDSVRYGACFLWGPEKEGDRALQLQLRERRVSKQIQRELEIPWKAFAVKEWTPSGRWLKDFEALGGALGAAIEDVGDRPVLLCATLGVDYRGKHMEQYLRNLQHEGARLGLVEGPGKVDWERGQRHCESRGWGYGIVDFITTENGEALTRRRRCLVVNPHGALPEAWEEFLVRAMGPAPMSSLLKPKEHHELCWTKPLRLELESGIPRDRMLPQPAGHVWWGEEREVIHGIGGPGRWPLLSDDGSSLQGYYVYDRRGPGGHVRRLDPEELWVLQGRQLRDLPANIPAEVAVIEGVRATGIQTAANLVTMGGQILCELIAREAGELNPGKAGMMPDATGAEATQILLWLRRWKRGELRRSPPSYEADTSRAGGGTGPPLRRLWRWSEAWWWAQCMDEEEEDDAYTLEFANEIKGSYAGGRTKAKTDPLKVAEKENMTGDKSAATEKAYGGAWMKWCAWARRQGWPDEFLNRNVDPIENENRALAYVGYLGWLGASPNTIRQHIFAMKMVHKRSGRGDPLDGMHRVWILVNALDRRSTTRKPRRLGVTPEMLVWLGENLVDPLVNDRHSIPYAEAVMVVAALELAWFFMLRAKEFGESNGVDESMITRGCDIRLSHQGVAKPVGEATEISLFFRKTKNDQLAFGDTKTLQATGRKHLCPVEALDRMRQVWTMRFLPGHAESTKPLFRWSNGQVIKRIEIQHFLQEAAVGVGLPPGRFMSHSLRIGGASALFQSTADIELVKRAGRWSSSAVQRYLFDGGSVSAVSKKMAAVGDVTTFR
ncbi:unnamed protein product [Durusdinium trenchii]|uniref:Uncharacterized protein n=1 Tax=Durusdinium trenchii TaxID=1381693 RepID=A0ABP0SR05_9DINO